MSIVVVKDEIAERLDDLADLAAIWAARRADDRPAPMIREALLRACGELADYADFERQVQQASLVKTAADGNPVIGGVGSPKQLELALEPLEDPTVEWPRVPGIRGWVKGEKYGG